MKEMRKGQMSFDLLLTIVVALVFIASFQNFSHQMTDSEKIITIQNQEKIIAENLKQVFTETRILAQDNSLYLVKYKIPEMLEPGKPAGQECTLQFTDAGSGIVTIAVIYDLELSDTTTEPIRTEVQAVIADSALIGKIDALDNPPSPKKCGDILELTNIP